MKLYKTYCRRYVTLIETMIALAILGLVASVIGINVSKAMQDQRFRTEVALVIDQLRLAQNLMLILNEDVKVHFKEVNGQIYYGLSFQCPLRSGWDKELTRKPQPLKAIRTVAFKGVGEEKAPGSLTLKFFSAGIVMSRGTLTLSTARGFNASETRYVNLPGYPHPIEGVTNEKSALNQQMQVTRSDEQLTQFIMPEIITKFQSNKSGVKEEPTPP
ncbi:MAG: type II secretion system protein [Parachlamydiaceae bacterium]|nr:type II secretion system protein [Parachlamydiaceae bacterium]